MRKPIMAALCASLTLSACSATSDPEVEKKKFLKASGEENAVNVKFTNRSATKSVLGFRAINVMLTSGDQQFQGSAISSADAGGPIEGANCTIKGDGYSASFDTPAIVNMPSFGKETTSATITCTYDDDKTVTERVSPVNLSQKARTSGAVAVGLVLCTVCGVAMAAGGAGDKTGDAFGFQDINLKVK